MKRLVILAGTCASVALLSVLPVAALPLCAHVGPTLCAQRCAAYGQHCASWWKDTCDSEVASFTFACSSITIRGECDCGSNGTCFLAGTEITLADGGTKPIEEIRAGDVVLAFDEVSGEMRPDTVRAVHPPAEVGSYLVVNDRLHLTPSHPVLSDGAWVEIGELAVGDTLTAADGSAVLIETLRTVDEPVTVYNFAVNPYGTYVAEGVVVHNKQYEGEDEPVP